MKGCKLCFIREEAHTNERFVSSVGHQLYKNYMPSSGGGVDLEEEGIRFIEMHRGLHTPPSRGGDLELVGGVNVCL